jgi:hypothetical protein
VDVEGWGEDMVGFVLVGVIWVGVE